ncbi:MAG: sulfatase-like hydrolase/transferase [SAR324 cluster bacterium]|nr:sulfatase-like hydrolase/transferase [SAR324 cluster bacterium]
MKSSDRELAIFLFVLILIDLGIRWERVREWSTSECTAYVFSIFLSATWAILWRDILSFWAGSHPRIFSIILSIWGLFWAFVYLGAYQFYFFFKNIPNVTTVRFILEESQEVLTFFPSSAWVWLGFLFLSVCIIGFWQRLVKLHSRKAPVRFSKMILLVWILLSAVAHNNVWLLPGTVLPGVNAVFSFTKSLERMARGQGNIRVLQTRHLPTLPDLGKGPALNILLIVQESLRAGSTGFDGYHRPTSPQQSAFLKQEFPDNSFIFPRAFSNSTNTHLSFPSILSGIHPGQSHQTLHAAPLLYEYARMYSQFKTFIISSHSHEYGNFNLYLQSQYLDVLWNREIGKKPRFNSYGADDKYLAVEFEKFLENSAWKNENFAGVIQFNGTHYPYTAPESFRKWNPGGGTYDDNYDNSILYVDHIVGQILNLLKKNKLLENTVVISTSDHGSGMGEHHGEFGHLKRFYNEGTRVPFWIYLPAPLADRYRRVLTLNQKRNVQNLDIVPSILEILELQNRPELSAYVQQLKGSSLFDEIRPDRYIVMQNANAYYASQFAGFGALKNDFKTLFYTSGDFSSLERYNILKDPGETQNVWQDISEKELHELKEFLKTAPLLKSWAHRFFPEL